MASFIWYLDQQKLITLPEIETLLGGVYLCILISILESDPILLEQNFDPNSYDHLYNSILYPLVKGEQSPNAAFCLELEDYLTGLTFLPNELVCIELETINYEFPR